MQRVSLSVSVYSHPKYGNLQADMAVPSPLFCLFFSVSLVFGQLPDSQGTLRSRNGDPKKGGRAPTRIQKRQQRSVDNDCQEGDPLGASYLGKTNVTSSGIPCQAWTDTHPHEHSTTDLGEHNHCRNPDQDPEGVWCYTTDPDKRWEHCSVPICSSTSETPQSHHGVGMY